MITAASGNTIGGTAAGAGNLISGNGGRGVDIQASTSTENELLSNSIASNDSLGIDVGSDGVTANDSGDLDTGANDRQNFPVLSGATNTGSDTAIAGNLNSEASQVVSDRGLLEPFMRWQWIRRGQDFPHLD